MASVLPYLPALPDCHCLELRLVAMNLVTCCGRTLQEKHYGEIDGIDGIFEGPNQRNRTTARSVQT